MIPVKLVKQVAHRDNKEYVDFYLVWRHSNKLYSIRVRPCFWKDLDKLYATSETIPEFEDLEKYY